MDKEDDFNPQSIGPLEYRRSLTSFLLECEQKQLDAILVGHAGPREAHALYASVSDLIHFDPILACRVLRYPRLLLPLFNQSAIEAQDARIKILTIESRAGAGQQQKQQLQKRVLADLMPFKHFLKETTIRKQLLVHLTKTVMVLYLVMEVVL